MDSTRMVESLGDESAADIFAKHDRCARDLLHRYGGQEIDKSDGFLLLFAKPFDAVLWALAYHEALAVLSAEVHADLRARVGIHVGQIVRWRNREEDVALGAKPIEVEGIAKPMAARLMGAALGGQILLTRVAYELSLAAKKDLPPDLSWLRHGEYEFKGVAEPVEVFEVGLPGAPLRPPEDGAKVRRRQTRHNLPPEATGFVGRTRELADIDTFFNSNARLVTVLGPGGTGKTRICLRYAREHLDTFPGGVWLCDLSEAKDAAGVCQAVARALDVPLTIGEPARQLGDVLAGRGASLLLLDNFEQVAAESSRTVGMWLTMAPDARFLVSSREPLHLANEQRLRMDALPLPAASATLADLANNDAVTLFVMRARVAKSGFDLNAKNAADIGAIVRELDGLPLAIELAAARIPMLAPPMLRARLSRRFDLLRGQQRGVHQRQATLRGAIDWSWDLLEPWDKAALAQCSAFASRFSLEAAEAVIDLAQWPEAPFPMDVVQSLVEKSLVRPPDDDAPVPRFSVSASIRAYAEEKMGEAAAVSAPDGSPVTGPDARAALFERHSAYFAQLGEDESLSALDRHGGAELFRDIQAEIGNLELAIERSLAPQPEVAARACFAAVQVYRQRGPFADGARLAGRVVTSVTGLEPGLAGRLLVAEGSLLKLAGRGADAMARYESALAVFRGEADEAGEASALFWLHFLHRGEGRIQQAAEALEGALERYRRLDMRSEEGDAVGNIASLLGNMGDVDGGARRCIEALDIVREVGNLRSEAMVLACLGVYESMRGRLHEAGERMAQALELHREVGNRRSEGVVTRNLGYLRWEQGRLDESAELASETLAIAREVGDRRSEASALADLGRVRRDQGEMDEARRLSTAALDICLRVRQPATETWVQVELAEISLCEGNVEAAQAAVDAGLACSGGRIRAADGVLHGIAGEIAALRGDVETGLALLATAEQELSAFASRQLHGLVLCRRARVLAREGQTAACEAALSEARTIRAQLGVGDRSPLGRALVVLAGGAG